MHGIDVLIEQFTSIGVWIAVLMTLLAFFLLYRMVKKSKKATCDIKQIQEYVVQLRELNRQLRLLQEANERLNANVSKCAEEAKKAACDGCQKVPPSSLH